MAITNTFGGFPFDGEVFADYMQQQPAFRNELLTSGIVAQDQSIMDLVSVKGNVGSMPYYNPLDASADPADNYDGDTDQNPSTIQGGQQLFTTIGRMKSWTEQDFTVELTGAKPLDNVGSQVANYYTQVWEDLIIKMCVGILGVTGMSTHISDISSAGGAPVDANLVDATTLLYAKQYALGDLAGVPGLVFMHSKVYTRYLALNLLDFQRYTIQNALGQTVGLPSINGDIVIQRDAGLSFTNNAQTAYRTLIVGRGAFLSARKNNLVNPYYVDYDPKTKGGTKFLYTKEVRVLHPNGMSIVPAQIAKASPTAAEMLAAGTWSLAFNHKNVRIGQLITNG